MKLSGLYSSLFIILFSLIFQKKIGGRGENRKEPEKLVFALLFEFFSHFGVSMFSFDHMNDCLMREILPKKVTKVESYSQSSVINISACGES